MSWDPIWEEIFRLSEWGRYPPEELIRFVAKHFYSVPDRNQIKVLELGCGPGANIWFLTREGLDAYGIDGSEIAISNCEMRMRQEGLNPHLQVGDVVSLCDFFPTSYFDAVIDVACLQCNRFKAVQSTLDQVLTVLKPHGRVFSMMLAAGSWGEGLGTEVEPGTFVDIKEGAGQGEGLNHFFTLEEVQQLFQGFSEVQIEHSTRSVNHRQHSIKYWVTQAVKNP